MKYILITLLFTTNIYANFKFDIIPNDAKYAKMSVSGETLKEAKKEVKRFIRQSKFFKGEWNNIKENSIAEKIVEGLEENVTLYYHPSNYTLKLDPDYANEIKAREDLKKERNDEGKALKVLLNSDNDLTPKQIKRIFKRLFR